MSTLYGPKTAVVFNISALFYTSDDIIRTMPHAREVLEYLHHPEVHLIATSPSESPVEQWLSQHDLTYFFTRNGKLQHAIPSYEREPHIEPKTYYKTLKQLGVEDTQNAAAIVGHFDETKQARASGIRHIVGFYGSPATPIGQIRAQKAALERDIAALAGTKLTTTNLREAPELLGFNPQQY